MRKGILSAFATALCSTLLAGCVGCGALVSDERVSVAAEKQGYKNVQVVSKHIFFVSWRGCGKDDDAAFNATGVNATGNRVDLIICAGWPFKGVTVRTK